MDMDWEPELPGQWSTPDRNHRQRATVAATFSNTLSRASNLALNDYPFDWEPEIPGQFNTPLRISRKRVAAEAGLCETAEDPRFYTHTIALQSLVPKSNYFAPIASIFTYTFRIFNKICSATARGAKATGNNFSAVAGSRRVVETRSTTVSGFESAKRRVVDSDITGTVDPTSEQITRKNRTLVEIKSPRSSHRKAVTRQMAPLTGLSVEREPPSLGASIDQRPPPPEALKHVAPPIEARITSAKSQATEPSIDRVALGARISAGFTPRPIPGSRELLAISKQTVTLIDGQPNPSSIIEMTDTKPTSEEPTSLESHSVNSSKFDRPEKIQPAIRGVLLDPESRSLSGDTYRRSNRLENRRSMPQLSASGTHGLINTTNTISETPKHVRFAMNNTNGLPQEYSVKFYRDSKIGEWAPSSPWADDQVLACTSDLKYNLEALLKEDSWLPPPSTPVLSRAKLSYSSADASNVEEPPSSPPDTDSLSEASSGSASDFSPLLVDTLNNLNQDMIDDHLVDESPIAQVPVASSLTDRPFARMKDLLTYPIRRLFSTSPLVTRSDITNKSHTQGTMDVSIEDHDMSAQMSSLNQSSLLLDTTQVSEHSPSILEGRMYPVPSGGEDDPGRISSPIIISGNDGNEDQVTKGSSEGTVRCLIGPDRSGRPHVTPRMEEDPVDAVLEPAMFRLEMSRYSKRKLAEAAEARKLAEAAATAKAKAEAEEAERNARSHRRMPREKLVKPLSKDWQARIDEAMGKGDNVVLTTTVAGTELRHRDFVTLLGHKQWLNDEIINAYLEWIVEYANKKAGKSGRNATPKVIAHNSFFYKNITDKGPNSVSRWMKRKKAEGKKLLEVETVLIPVNNELHWTIIIVSPKQRTIEYLDSFSLPSKVFIDHTKGWLEAELGNAWREEEWRVLQTKSARQMNGYDCGVFCVTNAECVAGGVDTLSYDGGDMLGQRARIAGVLLNRGFGGDFVPAEDL